MQVKGKGINSHFNLCNKIMSEYGEDIRNYYENNYKKDKIIFVFEVDEVIKKQDEFVCLITGESFGTEYIFSSCVVRCYSLFGFTRDLLANVFSSKDEFITENTKNEVEFKYILDDFVSDYLKKIHGDNFVKFMEELEE